MDKKLKPTEHQEQAALFHWASYVPELSYMFAIPNGAKSAYKRLPNGKTFSPEGQWLKSEGRKPGVPDIFLPLPKGCYHGMFLEMKRVGGKVSEAQMEFIKTMMAHGYYCAICYGFEDAKNELLQYLALQPFWSSGICK